MSYGPNQMYPGATELDPNYPKDKFKDNNPSTTNNGTPLKAIKENQDLTLETAVMNDAGFEYSGVADTPQDSQLFKAYKASLGNGANLLSNHNFLIQTPDDSQPLPSATPASYPPGYQIFSGVFANETTGITNLTYIDGRVSFSGGDLYFAVPNTGGIERLTEFAASVADFDGKPRTRGVSFALVGDEYRVTVGVDALEDVSANPTQLGSVKFEQGSVATGHESKSLFDIYGHPNMGIVNVKAFGAKGDGVTDDREAIQAASDSSYAGAVIFPFTGESYVIGSTNPTETDYGLLINGNNVIFESTGGGTSDPYVLLCTVAMKSVVSSVSRRDGLQFRNFSIDSNNLADHAVYLSDEYFPYMLWDNVHLTRSKINNAQLSTFTSTFNQCRFSRSEQDGVRIQGVGTGVATSVTMNTCYALQNVGKGFDFKNFIYSTLNSCASDTNAIAYYFDTTYSTVMSGCGAEGCEKAIYVNGYRGFSINQFYGAVLGTDGAPEEYLIEFVNGTNATITGFYQQSPKNYNYILASTGSSFGSENITVLDYSIKRDEIFFVTNFTFQRPIKLFRDDYSTKDETINLTPSELFDYLKSIEYKNIDHTLTIQLSDGAQPDENTPSLVKLKGAGTIIVQGNVADRSLVELRAGGLEPWFVDECSCLVKFRNLTIRNRTTDVNSIMLQADNARMVVLDNVDLYNSTTAKNAINAADGSKVVLTNGTEATQNPLGFEKVYRSDGSSEIKIEDGSGTPSSGIWDSGQKIYHSNPAAGGNIGWVCTSAGLPGVWKAFGNIDV